MTKIRFSHILALLVLAGLVLAGCTRSASSGAVPTSAPAATDGAGGGGETPIDADPTMAALGTQVSAEMTAAAAAGGGGGQAAETTPVAPGDVVPTAAPSTPEPVIIAPTVAPTAAPAATACSNPYIVKQGDWIYKIARECQVDPQALLAANPGIFADRITPGQSLNMPAAGAAPPDGCTGNYTVVRGDTLFRLAYNCGLDWEALAATNGIAYPYLIHPGDVLRFP